MAPNSRGLDPRLEQVLRLLNSLIEGGTDGLGAAASPWHPIPGAGPEDPWLVSATDLLTPWSPQLLSTGGDGRPPAAEDWGIFFRADGRAGTAAAPEPETAAPPERPADLPEIDQPAAASPLEVVLTDRTAAAATECLYDFIHALGRLDIDDAMANVALDYHAIEEDREVDHTAFRHRLEALLDPLRGSDLEVSLAGIPEPVGHPSGLVLIRTTIQIDSRPSQGMPTTLLLERIAALSETADGWRLAALSPLVPQPTAPLTDLTEESPLHAVRG